MTPHRWTTAGTVCLILTPLLTAAADVARMRAEHSGALTGMVSDYGREQAAATYVNIEASAGLYQLAGWLALAAALLTIPAVGAVRTLTRQRSPRWSTAALVTGICLVIGQFVHLMGYYVWNQIMVAHPDREAAITMGLLTNENTYGFVVFAPYLLGVLLCWPVTAVALWRSRLLAVWALVAVLAAGLAMDVAGSSFLATPLWAVATAAGFTPVLVTRLRSPRTTGGSPAVDDAETSPSSSAVRQPEPVTEQPPSPGVRLG